MSIPIWPILRASGVLYLWDFLYFYLSAEDWPNRATVFLSRGGRPWSASHKGQIMKPERGFSESTWTLEKHDSICVNKTLQVSLQICIDLQIATG